MFRGFVNTFSISPFSVLGVGYSRLTVYTVIIRCFRQFVAVLQMRRQLGALAQNDPALADDFFEPYLKVIEQDIHQRQNRVREAMNNTLIAIGSRNSALQEKALAVAEKIGEVYVDHGETACKTPEAVSYIHKTVQRKKEKGQWD